MRSNLFILLIVLSVLALAGCVTQTEVYEGHAPEEVWRAMIAAAESPTYHTGWTTEVNEVTVYDEKARLEVYRELRRDHVEPGGVNRQERKFRQSIWLHRTPRGPMIKFRSRHLDVPTRARGEAWNYFDDVWELLGGKPEPPASEPASLEDGDFPVDTTTYED